jgi:predicted ATPase
VIIGGPVLYDIADAEEVFRWYRDLLPTLPQPGSTNVLAPIADHAAVLAEALILLLRAMAAGGAVLLMDDMHWADEDTISVLSYLADSVEPLPLALIMTTRTGFRSPSSPQQIPRVHLPGHARANSPPTRAQSGG